MNVVVNLLVELHDTKRGTNIILRSHLLKGKTRACRCNIPKQNKREITENVPLELVDQSYNLCEGSRKQLNKDLDKLKDWLDGRPTQL